MQKHSYYLVKYFARQGIYVDLYHVNDSHFDIEKLEFFSEAEKVYIRSFVFTFPKRGRWPWHYLKESYEHSKAIYACFIRQEPVDFIYTKGYTGWYFIEQKRKIKHLPPIGLRLHGYEIFQQGRGMIDLYRKILYMPLVKFLNAHCDYIYSYGGGITSIIQKNIPNSGKKIIEIPAAIEFSWLYDYNTVVGKPVRFAFLGRYERRKGIHELNEVLKKMESDFPFEFHFIGPIPVEMQIQSDKIVYHGSISDAEKIKSVLQNTDVFVLPSHAEGMPNVILEAMANGCAILATDVGAVNVMVDSSNGWLIPPMQEKALEFQLKDICMLKPDVIDRKKRASVEKVRFHFTWEEIIKKEKEAIEAVCRG